MGKRVIAMLAAALLATFALAACGGDDDNGDSSSADEDGITKAIDASAASGNPTACTQYQTQNFLEQTNGGTGQAAVKSCEQDADQGVADTVEVSDVEVDGSTATAKAAVTGSIFDGQTLDLALVKEGDIWKLDRFNGFEDFDKDAIVAGFKKELESEPGTNPQAVDCVVQQFEGASEEEIQAFFTESDPQSEDRFFRPCEKYFQGQ